MEAEDINKVESENESSAVLPLGLKSVLTNYVWNQATQILTIVTGVLLARILGPHERGLLAAAVLWPSLVLNLGVLGVPTALGLRIRKNRDRIGHELGKGYGTLLILAVAETVLLAVLLRFLVPRTAREVVPWSYFFMLIIPVSHIGWISLSFLRSAGWYKWAGVATFLQALTYCASLMVFWLLGIVSYGTALIAILSGSLVCMLVSSAAVWKRVALQSIRWSRELIQAGRPFFVETLAGTLGIQLSQYLILLLLDPGSLGYYVIAASYAGFGFTLTAAVSEVLLYRFAEKDFVSGGLKESVSMFRRSIIVQWIPFAVLAAFAPLVIPLMFGVAFVAAVVPSAILSASFLLKSQTWVLMTAMRANSKAVQSGALQMLSVVCLFTTVPAGISMFGISGCAAGVAISSLVDLVLIQVYCRRRWGICFSDLYAVNACDLRVVMAGFARVIRMARSVLGTGDVR